MTIEYYQDFRAALKDRDKGILSQTIQDIRRQGEARKIKEICVLLDNKVRVEADRQMRHISHVVKTGKDPKEFYERIPDEKRYIVAGSQYKQFHYNEYYHVLRKLYSHGRLEEEIQWCGRPSWNWQNSQMTTWGKFAALLRDFFGEISAGYQIVGTTWWMKREYDPAWEFPTWIYFSIPEQPTYCDEVAGIETFDPKHFK